MLKLPRSILQSSGRSLILAKGLFGRLKTGATQDRHVKVKLRAVKVTLSTIPGEDCECVYGSKQEGEADELYIPTCVLRLSKVLHVRMYVKLAEILSESEESIKRYQMLACLLGSNASNIHIATDSDEGSALVEA